MFSGVFAVSFGESAQEVLEAAAKKFLGVRNSFWESFYCRFPGVGITRFGEIIIKISEVFAIKL